MYNSAICTSVILYIIFDCIHFWNFHVNPLPGTPPCAILKKELIERAYKLTDL